MALLEDQLGQSTPSSTTPVDIHNPGSDEHVSYTTLYVTNHTTGAVEASWYHNNSTNVFNTGTVLRHHLPLGKYGSDKIPLGAVSSSTKSSFGVQSHNPNDITFTLYGVVRTT